MPDPETLKVGDSIRFTSLPTEWADTDRIHEWDIDFMHKAIASGQAFAVYQIDEYGQPWIDAVVDGEEHTWAIMEATGWEVVTRA